MISVQLCRANITLTDFELRRAIDMMVSVNNEDPDRSPVPYGAFDLESTTLWYESAHDFAHYQNAPAYRLQGEPKVVVKCSRSGATVAEEFNMSPQNWLSSMLVVEGYTNQSLLYRYHCWIKREDDLVYKRMIDAVKR